MLSRMSSLIIAFTINDTWLAKNTGSKYNIILNLIFWFLIIYCFCYDVHIFFNIKLIIITSITSFIILINLAAFSIIWDTPVIWNILMILINIAYFHFHIQVLNLHHFIEHCTFVWFIWFITAVFWRIWFFWFVWIKFKAFRAFLFFITKLPRFLFF